MPRQSGFQLENNFTKGLITESTGLNFPENACTETYDCIFSEKGRVTRRLGFDEEGGNTNTVVDRTASATVEYLWNAAGGSGTTNIVVVQVGATLYYYKVVESGSLSSNIFGFTTNLLTYQVTGGSDVKGNICQFASGNGKLFVVHPLCEPFSVTFDASGPSITEAVITIKTRDMEGDRTDTNYNNISTRPNTLTDAHEYNLYNQGWGEEVRIDGGGASVTAISNWDAERSDFPSMADVWWLYRDQNNEFNISWVDRLSLGNTPAPKGHFILTEFNTDRSGAHADIGTVTERTSGGLRPTTVAFFTQRVWYAGVNAQGYNQRVYFSQIIESDDQFGKCHQLNDPTSSETFDLLPSDGGVIIIPDAGNIIKLFPMANSLLVFTTTGVWSIGGSEGLGFKATDYAIRRISAVESLSPLSFVDVFGTPIWWNTDGIWTIGGSDVIATESVTSLTDMTIKTFFLEIPSESKRFVKGSFNPRSHIVQWLYKSTVPADTENSFVYDRVLNLNVLSKAFYPWTIGNSSTSPTVNGIIVCRSPSSQPEEVTVVDASVNTVVDASGNIVIINNFVDIGASFSFRYYATDNTAPTTWNATWMQTIDQTYKDWASASENLDYLSYFFTGYKIHGDAIRFFENNYLTISMSDENNASCFIQGVWEYSNSPSSAYFTNPQQIYISRVGRDVQQTRKKIRGRGRSLHFKFYSETGKPFTIHGWTGWETQNQDV